MDLKQYLVDLEYLVNIDSGPECRDGQNEIARFFKRCFDEIGWNTKFYHMSPKVGDCLICTNREAEHYDLMLIGHLDTVFPRGTVAERPFRIEGNKAFGPGVLDMKQGSLLMYYILKELSKEVNDRLNIVAVFNPDEEIGSRYSKTVYEEYAKKTKYAYIYEGASADMARCNQRKGSFNFTVDFTGKAGHCGYVFTNGARSAVSEMARWIVRLDTLQSMETDTTVNVGTAQGGFKSNVVAPNATMTVDMRIAINEEFQYVEDTLRELEKESSERGIYVEIKNKRMSPALSYTPQSASYVKHVEELTKALEMDYKHRKRGGLSDANKLAQFGVVCLDGMGPAGDDDHSPDEYLLIDSVIPTFELSMALIEDLVVYEGKIN